MTFNHKVINEFLEAIFPLPDEFGLMCYGDESGEPVNFNSFIKKIKRVDPHANANYGMSKIVISSPQLDNIVIKIPFNGYFNEDYEDDNDYEDSYWTSFYGATGSDCGDYCLAEFEKYKKLKTYGLDCFVAKTLFYKTIDGIRVFLQEYVTPVYNSCTAHKASKKSKDIADEWRKAGKIDMNTEWIANCLDKYGKAKVERFLYYCKNIDEDILRDMHSGNYGYRNNGTPCLLDFSDFNV